MMGWVGGWDRGECAFPYPSYLNPCSPGNCNRTNAPPIESQVTQWSMGYYKPQELVRSNYYPFSSGPTNRQSKIANKRSRV